MILFNSFFLGGFECSTHSRPNGTRLDLIAATGHDQFAELDYERLKAAGLLACRDGLRWHLIERVEKQFDFSSAIPMIRAARRAGMQVIWDLFHYGWPDGLDIFSPQFVDRFARFARESARIIVEENEEVPWFVVINEPSFLCWAGGQEAFFPPFERGRSHELKMQLIRASIVATDAVRDVAPDARFIQVDPIINIVSDPNATQEMRRHAANYRQAQFHCWDMLAGYDCPELGGGPEYIDVIGCNYYVHNQWVYNGSFIERTDPRYRPLEDMLAEVQERYGRPILLAETGIEEE
ncbi:MAG: beta-glucosidase, partial [Bryobacteraceae bacterium]|nr:beta-glucosidase [Bryobacteraceae bacterium]